MARDLPDTISLRRSEPWKHAVRRNRTKCLDEDLPEEAQPVEAAASPEGPKGPGLERGSKVQASVPSS